MGAAWARAARRGGWAKRAARSFLLGGLSERMRADCQGGGKNKKKNIGWKGGQTMREEGRMRHARRDGATYDLSRTRSGSQWSPGSAAEGGAGGGSIEEGSDAGVWKGEGLEGGEAVVEEVEIGRGGGGGWRTS